MPAMMTDRFKTLFVSLFAALAFSACASAQIEFGQDDSSFDPTAPDAVVEYGGPDPLVIETASGPVSFTVELAETEDARNRGMMHRSSMDPDTGMLFDFEIERVVSIWMRNTQIPLDIIYIRADGTIAKIVANAVPYSLRPMYSDYPVISVLEIAGGRAHELGIEPGDLVRHAWFGTAEPVSETEPAAQDGATEPTEDG